MSDRARQSEKDAGGSATSVRTKPLVEVKNLKVYFPVSGGIFRRTVGHVKAVDDVSLSLAPGKIVSVVGESGCGKSTLGNAILGLVQPTDGEVRLDGQRLDIHRKSSWDAYRKDFQIIFQDPYTSLNPRHTIFEIVSEPLLVHGLCDKKSARDAVAALLAKVGLSPDYMGRYPHAFSGGQRQRINIARAIGLNPKAIVADEIVAALDVSIQAQIINLLIELKDELGLSLLFISHDLSLVRSISDEVYVMYLGRIAEAASADQLFTRPRHHYTRALLDSIPTLDRSRRPALLSGEVPSPVNPPSGCAFHTRCPAVQDRCRKDRPELKTAQTDAGGNSIVAPDQSRAACWFPLPDSAS
ncbi:MAG: ATP-binding cassette domain-containing protein [Leptospirales bacterium]|jgi:oligopeptide/dipeptide ABC transporter ATP-binding protein